MSDGYREVRETPTRCLICGGTHSCSPGLLLPLCHVCEKAWQASPERGEPGARQRFITRKKAGIPHDSERAAPAFSIAELQKIVGEWADRVFPDRTVHTSLAKLVLEEIPEFLMAKADDADEYADLVILILDVAHQKGINVEQAVLNKHQRNVNRAWVRTESGVYHNAGVGMPK